MQLTVHSGPMSRIQCQTSAADYLIGGNCNHGYKAKIKVPTVIESVLLNSDMFSIPYAIGIEGYVPLCVVDKTSLV